jgi:hypothetical protein
MTDVIVRFLLVGAGAFLFLAGVAWMILRAILPRGGSGFLAGLLLGWVAGRQRPAEVVVRGAPSPVVEVEPRRRVRWLWIVLGALALYAIARHGARAEGVSIVNSMAAARATTGVSVMAVPGLDPGIDPALHENTVLSGIRD